MMRRSSGFTLVEIGIIVPIIMIIAIGLFSSLFEYLNSSARDQARLYQSYSQSTALSRIEADVKLSAAFLSTKDTTMVADPYESASSGGTWGIAGTGTTHRVLILREYATTTNPLSNLRSAVYVKATGAPDCSTAANVGGQLTYNIIYFINTTNNTLYKRTLTDLSSPACTSQYEKLSCPPGVALGGANHCAAYDEVIATNVSGFSVDYYADQSTSVKLDPYTTPSVISTALSVNLTLENTQRAYNGSVVTSSSLRILSQNQSSGGSN